MFWLGSILMQLLRSTCENGTMVCPALPCPSYGPWSTWSPCSSSCGSGRTSRHRTCEPNPGGVPCMASGMQETAECSPQPCPGEHPASPPPSAPALPGVGTEPCPPQPAASSAPGPPGAPAAAVAEGAARSAAGSCWGVRRSRAPSQHCGSTASAMCTTARRVRAAQSREPRGGEDRAY